MPQGSMAMQVIWELNIDNTVNFYQPVKTQAADWWKESLLNFDQCDEQVSATKAACNAVGLDIRKVTHRQ